SPRHCRGLRRWLLCCLRWPTPSSLRTSGLQTLGILLPPSSDVQPAQHRQRDKLFSRRLRDSDKSSSDSDGNDYRPQELYVGCFHDDEQSPLLEFGFISGGFIIEQCYMHCTDDGATFMGLKYGFQCSCGFGQEEDYTLNGTGECACECYGDRDGNYGGQWAFDLYSLGGGDDSSTSLTPSPTAPSTGFPMPSGFPILSAAPSTSFTWGLMGGRHQRPPRLRLAAP
ncbi:unnamed protein product, partial [Ectocarpus sp. 4 AP-2014]